MNPTTQVNNSNSPQNMWEFIKISNWFAIFSPECHGVFKHTDKHYGSVSDLHLQDNLFE
jgi:hypothetical protein